VSKDGSIAIWEQALAPIAHPFVPFNSLILFVQPGKIKTERSGTPQIIESGLGEVLCVFYNPETKQFWTSHKTSSTIVLWSSSGDKDREIKCARLSLKPSSTPHISHPY
jgi:hypothetical protein